jgi:hypothetical protein
MLIKMKSKFRSLGNMGMFSNAALAFTTIYSKAKTMFQQVAKLVSVKNYSA